MNLIVDYTNNEQFSVGELQSMEEINEITFIVPIFLFLQNNFKLLFNYVQFLSQRPLIKTNIEPVATEDEVKQLQQYNVVLVRGTFDHLHLGHQVLLLKAIFSSSHKLIIEVKDDSIMKNKLLKELIQPIDVRKEIIRKWIETFVKDLKPQLEIKILTITEPYGSAPYTKGIDALVVTEESLHSFKHINVLRKSNNGLKKVQMILSPMLVTPPQPSSPTKSTSKLSSRRIRQYLLTSNNFTLSQYLSYRQIWDSLVKEIYSLCRIKDVDFIVVEKWWQRVVYKHSSKRSTGKKQRKNNKEIYLAISEHNNQSTPNQHSLSEVAMNLALLFDGVEEEEKNMQAVIKNFLENLLKKKGKSKTCRKIRKMILNDVKEFVQKSNPKKLDSNKTSSEQLSTSSRHSNHTAIPQLNNSKTTLNQTNITQPIISNNTYQIPTTNDSVAAGQNTTIETLIENQTLYNEL